MTDSDTISAGSQELPDHSAEFEALNSLVEAGLILFGPVRAVAYLHLVAASLELGDDNVFKFTGGSNGARARRESRAWLRRSVTTWLAKFG